jgi:hypothetical protein
MLHEEQNDEMAAGWSEEEMEFLNADAMYDAFLSQYDDDPSPYDGTYSEE